MLLNILKNANLLLFFLNELAVLAALGYWGFYAGASRPLKMTLGLGLPIIAVFIWAYFGAPASETQLQGFAFLLLRIFFFGSGALALIAASRRNLGLSFAGIVILNQTLGYVWHQ